MSIKMNDVVQEILHNTTLHFTARESDSGLPVVIKVGVTSPV